jgi:hypothetical protein
MQRFGHRRDDGELGQPDDENGPEQSTEKGQ